jgi:hypothetical protein
MRGILIVFVLMVAVSARGGAWFSKADAGYAGEYLLSFAGGARGLGLGLGPAASGGQAQSLYANPAGVASLWWHELTFSVVPLFGEGNYTYAGFGYPVDGRQAFGISMARLASNEAEKTNALGESVGSFSDQEMAVLLTYGRKLKPELSAGVTAKFVSQELDSFSARGAGLDAGLLYEVSPGHIWGMTLANLLPAQLGEDRFPLALNAGCCHAVFHRACSVNLDLALVDPAGAAAVRWGAGVEYRYVDWFALRAGMNFKQASAGFGLTAKDMDFDYALIYHPLGLLHAFTLSMRYGFVPSVAEEKAQAEREELAREKETFRTFQKQTEERLRGERGRLRRDELLNAHFMEAQRKFENRQYDDAQNILEDILHQDPGREGAQRLLAEIKARTDIELAARRLEEAEKSYRQGDYSPALSAVQYVLDVQPENRKAQVLSHLIRARLQIRDRRYGEAKGELMEALQLDPENSETVPLLKRLQTILELSNEP